MATRIKASLKELDIAVQLRAKKTDTVESVLWTFNPRTPLLREPALGAFIDCISDRRASVRELAASKAGNWTAEPRIAAAVVAQFLKERNRAVLFNLIGAATSIAREKRQGHEAAMARLRRLASSQKGDKDNRIRAIKAILFAQNEIDIRQYASPDFDDLDKLLPLYRRSELL